MFNNLGKGGEDIQVGNAGVNGEALKFQIDNKAGLPACACIGKRRRKGFLDSEIFIEYCLFDRLRLDMCRRVKFKLTVF